MYLSFQRMFCLEKKETAEIYEGYSIFHSKDAEKADETFKMFIKRD